MFHPFLLKRYVTANNHVIANNTSNPGTTFSSGVGISVVALGDGVPIYPSFIENEMGGNVSTCNLKTWFIISFFTVKT